MQLSRKLLLTGAVFGITAVTQAVTFAQSGPVPRRDVERSIAGATRMLSTVGHWAAADAGGRFYFQFRANGTYTYTRIDSDQVVRAQQAGGFTLRESRRAEPDWPRVAGGGEGGTPTRGLLLTLRPGTITVQSSDPADLPGDEEADFRLMFRYGSDEPGSLPAFELLAASLPVDSEFGRLGFAKGP